MFIRVHSWLDFPVNPFVTVIASIDRYNQRDPRQEGGSGYEFLFSIWVTDWVQRLRPGADDLVLIAARGMHIGRWEVPRETFPSGLIGYYKWKESLKVRHAEITCGLMEAAGYPEASRARVHAMITRRDLEANPDAQLLEDAVCLVFLERQLLEFSEKHDDAKVADIIAKTLPKMSSTAKVRAMELPLDARAARLVTMAIQQAQQQ